MISVSLDTVGTHSALSKLKENLDSREYFQSLQFLLYSCFLYFFLGTFGPLRPAVRLVISDPEAVGAAPTTQLWQAKVSVWCPHTSTVNLRRDAQQQNIHGNKPRGCMHLENISLDWLFNYVVLFSSDLNCKDTRVEGEKGTLVLAGFFVCFPIYMVFP